jgi:hypothetical protein
MVCTRLTEAQCRAAMADGEFGSEVTASAETVIVVLTQSWCPQWAAMSATLASLPDRPGLRAFFLEYDREPFFEDFMTFKEQTLGNDLIPYVRYYRGGSLARTSNFLDKASLLRIIE